MTIALIGASGNAGSRILKELSSRGYRVTAIARHPEKIAQLPNVTAVKGDVFDKDGLISILRGHDTVISSVRFAQSDPRILIDAAKAAGAKRYLVVGGAGTLKSAPGVRVMDFADFPKEARPEVEGGARFLGLLREEHELDWTFLSPSMQIMPGERTGKFRLGTDQLLSVDGESPKSFKDAWGKSRISFEDYAVALVDELETPAHSRQRFTVGY